MRLLSNLWIVILFTSLLHVTCFSQSTGLPFLLISPFTEANGMGETSVALNLNDPVSPAINPAHLGMMSLEKYFTTGYNYANWLPVLHQSDLWYRTYAVNAGVNLHKLSPDLPALSFGMGYSSIYMNLGKNYVTYNNPTPVDSFTSYEQSEQVTFAVGFDFIVRGSLGYTTKHIYDCLVPVNIQGRGKGVATVDAYDLGMLLELPIMKFISKIQNQPFLIDSSLYPFFDVSFGLAQNNLGDKKVVYIDAAQAGPLPRYARAGMGINIGFEYTRNEITLFPLQFRWSVEANDILVKGYRAVTDSDGNVIREPYSEYQTGLGDINIWDEVILGRSNPETIHKKGWELTFFEFLSIRGGRFEEDPNHGGRYYSTSGFGLRLSGILKTMAFLLKESNVKNDILMYSLNHLDIRYNLSTLTTDEHHHPLDNTKFWGISLSFSNQ